MSLLLIGMNHLTAPIELREQFFVKEEELARALHDLHGYRGLIAECAIVSTCNRLELYCVLDEAVGGKTAVIDYLSERFRVDHHTLMNYLYICEADDAVIHLMRVASGLDSMVLGEDQILGQVSDAGQAAMEAHTMGPLLNRLFSSAAHAGKRARSETAINEHTTSISHAAAHLIAQHAPNVADLKVLIMGAGDMAELAAHALHDRGFGDLRIINRTYERAVQLAARVHARPLEWSNLHQELHDVHVVLTATGAPHAILRYPDLEPIVARRNGAGPLLMVDIAVPRNIDSAIDALEQVTVYDVDALQQVVDENMAQRRANVPLVERIVDVEADRFMKWWRGRQVVPTIKLLRQHVEAIATAEMAEAQARLAHLSEQEQAVVQRLVHRIVNKVLHAPMRSLHDHAESNNAAAFSQMVRELFALEFNGND